MGRYGFRVVRVSSEKYRPSFIYLLVPWYHLLWTSNMKFKYFENLASPPEPRKRFKNSKFFWKFCEPSGHPWRLYELQILKISENFASPPGTRKEFVDFKLILIILRALRVLVKGLRTWTLFWNFCEPDAGDGFMNFKFILKILRALREPVRDWWTSNLFWVFYEPPGYT